MSTEAVVRKLESYEHFGFKWIAAGSGGFHRWVTDNNEGPRPEFMTCGLCCFHLPLVAAIQTSCISRDRAGDLIVDQMAAGMHNQTPQQWAPAGLTKYRNWPLFANAPRRGDVVFFSGLNAPYFAHVAVATGNGDEVISFGHNAPYLQGGLHALMVERLTIADIKRLNNALTDVHFGTPSW